MPNWCYSHIELTANTPEQKSELNKILGFLDNTAGFNDGLFNQILPVDDATDRVDVWGTRSDIGIDDCDVDLELFGIEKDEDKKEYQFEDGEVSIELHFNTAWSPCIRVIEELHNKGLDVWAEFEEEGREFWFSWKNGIEEDISWSDATIENIPYFELKDNKLTAELVVGFSANASFYERREISITDVEIKDTKYLMNAIFEVIEDAIDNVANELDIVLDWEDNYASRMQWEVENAYDRSQKTSMMRVAIQWGIL